MPFLISLYRTCAQGKLLPCMIQIAHPSSTKPVTFILALGALRTLVAKNLFREIELLLKLLGVLPLKTAVGRCTFLNREYMMVKHAEIIPIFFPTAIRIATFLVEQGISHASTSAMNGDTDNRCYASAMDIVNHQRLFKFRKRRGGEY